MNVAARKMATIFDYCTFDERNDKCAAGLTLGGMAEVRGKQCFRST